MERAILLLLVVILSFTDARSYRGRFPETLVRTRRALNPIKAIRNWWSGNSGNRLVPLGQYPLWKVHKYNGISLNPVAVADSSSVAAIGPLPELSGPPPTVIKIPHATYSPPDELEPPKTPYDPPSYMETYEPRQPVYALPLITHEAPSEYGPPSTPSPVYDAPLIPSSTYGAPSTPSPVYGAPSTPSPVYGAPQQTYSVPSEYGPPSSNSFSIDTSINSNSIDSSQPGVNLNGGDDASSALSALDNIGGLTSFLPDPEGGSGGLDIATLMKIATGLPEGSVEKLVALLDFYNAQNNHERINALSNAASATVKLKADAANVTSHLIEDVFLGKNGDAGDIVLESGTYTNIPTDYPGKPGILPLIPPFSGASRNIPLPSLPEPPSLPNIPFLRSLKDLIRPPSLPNIYFPGTYTLPNYKVKGPYVSIHMPKPVTTYSVPNTAVTSHETPATSYETPATSYETPVSSYDAPKVPEQPPAVYGLPYPESLTSFNGAQTYSAPSVPVSSYGTPLTSSYSVSQGESSSFQPSGYVKGEVEVVPLPAYGTPHSETYQAPSQVYGTPQEGFNHNTYAAKSFSTPMTAYSVNDVLPSPSEKSEKFSRPAQDSKTGYSRVVLQNAPHNSDNSHSADPSNTEGDLRMYLDRDHPESTQSLFENQMRNIHFVEDAEDTQEQEQ